MAKRRHSRTHIIGIHDRIDPRKRIILLAVLTALLFLTTVFSIVETAKVTALVAMILTLLGCIFCFSTLRERINLPLIALLLFVLMNGISTAYALSGKFALREFLKLIIALCAALLLLMLTPGEGVKPGRRIAAVLEGSAALAALFSVDLISTRLLSTPLLAMLSHYSPSFKELTGVEPGVRLVSIFGNPNIFAGAVGIGVLLALGLALSSESKKERRFHLCCLYITSTAFVLAFSMGAIVAIAAAFLIYLLLEQKERRSELLLLMVKTLVLVFVSVILCAMTSLDTWDGFQPIPLLCLIIGSVLLCLADTFVGRKLGEKLKQHGKAPFIAIVVLIVLIAVFALIAYNLTGSISMAKGDTFRRSVYPAPGEYTVSVEGSEDVYVQIESQNRPNTMMHTSTTLYSGPLSGASFIVPEDSLVVYFNFEAKQAAELNSVTITSDNGSDSVPLGYKLLPDFIANRLQGLFANQNAIQRLVFFEDGITLFRRSPIVGLGLGAFENAICGVQSFFYETKYVHNHYIQVLLETGIIGLILFVGLLGLSAVAILLSVKNGNAHPLTPALGGILVFMAIHGGTEVVFSSQFYLPLAFGAFILISLCCGSTLPLPQLKRTAQGWTIAVSCVLLVVFGVLLCGNLLASGMVKRSTTFSAVERAVKMDKYEWADYALSYVLSSTNTEVPEEIYKRADEFAEDLSEINSNIVPLRLTQYYLITGRVDKAMAMAVKYAQYCSSDSRTWNNLFHMLSLYYRATDEFHAGVKNLIAMMDQWDEENIGTIELDESSLDFIEFVSNN